jgi:hypothetical protein
MSKETFNTPKWEGNSPEVEEASKKEEQNIIGEQAGTRNTKETNNENELTNNDGSIIETLDTAFHGKPGYIKDHSDAASNRAEYYEARSDGKSDAQDELDYLKNKKESN